MVFQWDPKIEDADKLNDPKQLCCSRSIKKIPGRNKSAVIFSSPFGLPLVRDEKMLL